jgi:hypothetical protein
MNRSIDRSSGFSAPLQNTQLPEVWSNRRILRRAKWFMANDLYDARDDDDDARDDDDDAQYSPWAWYHVVSYRLVVGWWWVGGSGDESTGGPISALCMGVPTTINVPWRRSCDEAILENG